MNRKWLAISSVVSLLLLLGVGGAIAQEPGPEAELGSLEGSQPRGTAAVAAVVNSRISYQGVLQEDGSLVTGDRDMVFRLYSSASCTAATQEQTINAPNVPVADGLFAVYLDVDHGDYDGQGLWLGVHVEGTEVVDCEEVVPVPYALSLRPGAVVADGMSEVVFNHYENSGPPLNWTSKYGIMGEVTGLYNFSYGVYGIAHDAASTSAGVHGRSEAATGTGVYGYAAGDGANYGVRGSTYGASGSYGGYFDGYTGVFGAGTGATGYGGHFTSTQSHGVYVEGGAGVTDDGIRIAGAGDDGIQIDSAGDNGIQVTAAADHGVRATGGSDSTDYGGYFTGYNGVRGYAHNAAGAGVYAANADSSGADLMLGGNDGRIHAYSGDASSDIIIASNDFVEIWLDADGGGEDSDFYVRNMDGTTLLQVDEGGGMNVRGNLRVMSFASGDTLVELGEGLDYAEGFDVAHEGELAPGTVLVIDTEHPGELAASASAYDTRVAGVVAGANGMGSGVRLGAGQFEYDVALAGRVYCLVDATETAVAPGDLLTTAARPGHAMVAADRARAQGAILGKAMAPLALGQRGLILVLVTLQ